MAAKVPTFSGQWQGTRMMLRRGLSSQADMAAGLAGLYIAHALEAFGEFLAGEVAPQSEAAITSS